MDKAKRYLAPAGGQRMSTDAKQLAHADSLDEQRSRYAQLNRRGTTDKWMSLTS